MMKFKTDGDNIISGAALAMALAFASPALAQDATAPVPAQTETKTATIWGVSTNDLTPDPAVRYGTLPNGMKYAIQKNEMPDGAASVRFGFAVGTVDEEENERGLAHFLEHMAFNGSTNIPEGELVKRLERLGLKFGPDTNASTGPDRTLYMLDLPKTDKETVDAALLMMREIASELTIAPEAVDRERGVIMAEIPTRNDANRRILGDWFTSALPESRVGNRIDGGLAEVIEKAPAERMKAFYRGFYHPERATLSVVGDFDVDVIEDAIRSRFSDWKAAGPARPRYAVAVAEQRELTVGNFVDANASEQLQFGYFAPVQPVDNSLAGRKQELLKIAATHILNLRISKRARDVDAPFIAGGVLRQQFFGQTNAVVSYAVLKAGDWQTAVAQVEQEMRRAYEFGFTNGEVTDAVTTIATELDNASKQAAGRSNSYLADILLNSAFDKSVIVAPSDALAMFDAMAKDFTPATVGQAFQEIWRDGPSNIHLTTQQPVSDASTAIRKAYDDSKQVAVTPPKEEQQAAFAYDQFGKAGKVVSDKRIADLGIRTVRFANDVKLNIRRSDTEPGTVHYELRVGGGSASLPKDQPGLALMMAVLAPGAGLGKHSIDEILKFANGKPVSAVIQPSDEVFKAQGSTSATDLELQLKLLAAATSDYGFRPETAAQWPTLVPLIMTNLSANPELVHTLAIPEIMANGDSRLGMTDFAVLKNLSLDQLKAAVDPELKGGPIEIALVGDVDEAAAIRFVANTLGALPKRRPHPALSKQQATVVLPTNRSRQILTHSGKDDQGVLSLNWPTTDSKDLKSTITREVLASIMTLKMTEELREKLSATYTPNVDSVASAAFPGYGYISATATSGPEKMELIAAAMRDIAKSLRDEPVSDDLLLRARQPIAEKYKLSAGNNGAWVGAISVAQSDPRQLNVWRKRASVLDALTVADIQKAAQQYLVDGGALEVRVVSKAVAEAAN